MTPRKLQWISILLEIIGCFGMGMNLFLLDGITHPTHMLTFFAAVFGIGMFGHLIGAFWRLAEEERRKQRNDTSER